MPVSVTHLPHAHFHFHSRHSWYNQNLIKTYDSGTYYPSSWSGKVIGVADSNNNPNNYPIVVKCETGSGDDWFVGFNSARGANAETKQAANQVTIYKVSGGNGHSYAHSFMKGSLAAGKVARITNWRDTGNTLVIQANSINTSTNPPYADVSISFNQPPPSELLALLLCLHCVCSNLIYSNLLSFAPPAHILIILAPLPTRWPTPPPTPR